MVKCVPYDTFLIILRSLVNVHIEMNFTSSYFNVVDKAIVFFKIIMKEFLILNCFADSIGLWRIVHINEAVSLILQTNIIGFVSLDATNR